MPIALQVAAMSALLLLVRASVARAQVTPEGSAAAGEQTNSLEAMLVEGLARHSAGRSEDAHLLIWTYVTLGESDSVDPRAVAALRRIETERGPLDPEFVLSAADGAILDLDMTRADLLLRAVREVAEDPAHVERALELQGLSAWTDGRVDEARARWEEMFLAFPDAAVDPELSPGAMRVMAQAQAKVREAAPEVAAEKPPGPPPAAVLLGIGAGTAAVGFALSRVSHAQGDALYPGLSTSPAAWDAGVGTYEAHRTREGVGAAVAAAGSAAVVAGITSALVELARKKKRVARAAR